MTRVHEDPARITAVVKLASRDLRGMETHITTEGQVREAVAHAREMSSSAQGLYGLHEVACPSVSHRLPTLNEPTTQLGAEYEREGQSRIDSYSPGGTLSPALSCCCLAPGQLMLTIAVPCWQDGPHGNSQGSHQPRCALCWSLRLQSCRRQATSAGKAEVAGNMLAVRMGRWRWGAD